MNRGLKNTIENPPKLYAAVYVPTGEVWNFQRMEWVAGFDSNCFTIMKQIIDSQWGKDSKNVWVVEYKPTLERVYK